MAQKKHKKDALYGRELLALRCLAPYNAKIYRNFENEENNQNLMETKDDQVLY
jgi:hypothetical protein